MKTNYLLIDYENVQPGSLAALNGVPFRVLVFIGANQTRVPVAFARALQSLGSDAEYIQIAGSGRNALDFHIAFAIGELSQRDPQGYSHVISKDAGFDPLIAYARGRGILVSRSRDIADIPMLKLSNAKTLSEKTAAIVDNLVARGSSRPRKVKTLRNSINAQFMKALEETELDQIVNELLNSGHISIEAENVSYHLRPAN